MEQRPPAEIRCQMIYQGKVFEIWAAWQADDPSNHEFGRTQQDAREKFALRLHITFEHAEGGIVAKCDRFKDLVGVGKSTTAAEKHLMRQINRLSDKLDWREMFFELLAATGDAWRAVEWHEREVAAVRREVERREVAARFTTGAATVAGRLSGEEGPETPSGWGETPFRPE